MPRRPHQRPGRPARPGGPPARPAGTPARPAAPPAQPGGTPVPRAGGPAWPPPRRGPILRDDRGQVALEYIGFIPILLFVALCGIQLGWIAYVHEQADTAARTAARVEARKGSGGEAAGAAAVRGGLAPVVTVSKDADAVTATVTIKINSIVPGLKIDEAKATAVMPNDAPSGPSGARP
ncbi:TadE/TadG family type IV pilus assembly protein [Streptomyces katrae]|uniref:TadE/TadG family type IV pilus assembly protein n=1 Tax=Streptomyces katrae TaxID=68223 RepID=UPI0009A531B8|nr:TadE/TadG family type IV pilus assembly protein [Streptomyces katrae]